LREALAADQLFVVYQPQVALRDGRITGVEALVRWRHPERGLVPPDVFIPVAEQMGLVSRLGHWVLRTACRQAQAWIDAGIPPTRMAVNMSALQFRAPLALENHITAALADSGLSPHMLELELTESTLMIASRENADLLRRLRDIGITMAIDDFGTGYSSLDYLRQFPANRIKIAQIFIDNLDSVPGQAAIVKATIGLARDLDIGVVAEGVETLLQCRWLRSRGCDEAQGFYFATPLEADDAAALLRRGRLDISRWGDAARSPV
jgi:EAL domain-containing protein (putative c-di-GMP-specific phosphodiesterase class I)